jgi:hypothetical protein
MKKNNPLDSIELKFDGAAENAFDAALNEHMKLHQGVTLFDLLKFLYQSSLGPFHLFEIMDEAQLKQWIRKNLDDAEPASGPLTEELYGKKWVRVNFGPYKKKFGNDYQKIYGILSEAKNMKQGELDQYKKLLQRLLDSIERGKIRPKTEESNVLQLAETFLEEYVEDDYPPIHHSKIYMLENTSEYLVLPALSMNKLC